MGTLVGWAPTKDALCPTNKDSHGDLYFGTNDGEPTLPPAGPGKASLIILQQVLLLVLLAPLALGLGLPYLALRLVVARPPNLPSPPTVRR